MSRLALPTKATIPDTKTKYFVKTKKINNLIEFSRLIDVITLCARAEVAGDLIVTIRKSPSLDLIDGWPHYFRSNHFVL